MTDPVQDIPKDGSDPSLNGAGYGLAAVLAPFLILIAANYGFALDLSTATLIIGGIIAVVGPVATALMIRVKAWSPDSVAEVQQAYRELLKERAAGEPQIVTRAPLTPVEASDAHPGVLGLSGPGEDAVGDEDGLPGRHVKKKGRS